MKKLIVFFVPLLIWSCSNKTSVVRSESLGSNDFENYVAKIESVSEVKIDSVFFSSIRKKNVYKKIALKDLKFVQAKFASEQCDENLKYQIFSVGKIPSVDNKVYILYYLNLNNKCQYDGLESIYTLCCYNFNGKLISEKIIGKFYQVFGVNEYIYFSYDGLNKIEIARCYEYDTQTSEGIISEFSNEILTLN